MHLIILSQLEATIGRTQAEELSLMISDCLTLAGYLARREQPDLTAESWHALRANLRDAGELAEGLQQLLEG